MKLFSDMDGSHLTNTVYTMPSGNRFAVCLIRETARRNLVTDRRYAFGSQPVYSYSTEYDLIGRPTNAVDSISSVREWLYNRRSELVGATIGTNVHGYAYDTIGNRLWSSVNTVTNSYTANCLNQYAGVQHSTFNVQPSYDADGNMTGDGMFVYAYDAENRLVSATSASETNGAIRVLNFYDHRSRRIRKVVQQFSTSLAPPPSPPVRTHEWETLETHTFVWDGNNIVLEKVAFANGTTRTFEYFWGADKSGSEQGAGGVEGLLAVSMDGVFYVPCYDHNGNIVCYVSESGAIAGQYVYDPYGNVVERYGTMPNQFNFGFSTKYLDRETGMLAYQRRFYRPDLGRWLNRDPIVESGGFNLYTFVMNNPGKRFDVVGFFVFPIIVMPDPTPPPPPEPGPSIIDQFGFSPLPQGEERWFERNYAGWLVEARRRFTIEIERNIDCRTTSFNGPSGRINIEPAGNRGGTSFLQTPGGNEREYGDAGQSDWSADKVLGSFSIDYETPVKITYVNIGPGKRHYIWSTKMYIYDVLGSQDHDPIRQIPILGDIFGYLTPSRGVKRATWILSGSGECDCNGGTTK